MNPEQSNANVCQTMLVFSTKRLDDWVMYTYVSQKTYLLFVFVSVLQDVYALYVIYAFSVPMVYNLLFMVLYDLTKFSCERQKSQME